MKTKNEDRIVRLPDFLIVGAAKSGTTSLYHYLKQHPRIFMPEMKEPWFFPFSKRQPYFIKKKLSGGTIWKFDEYAKLFEPATEHQLIGESSVIYLYLHKETIKNIIRYVPHYQNLKIIIVLRNPVDAIFSMWTMFKLRGAESQTFKDALYRQQNLRESLASEDALDRLDEMMKRDCPLDYLGFYFYYEQVKAYRKYFPKLNIYLYEDLKKDVTGLVQDIYKFLGINHSFAPDTHIEYNLSGTLRSERFHEITWKSGYFSSKFPLLKLIPLKSRMAIIDRLRKLNINRQKPQMEKEIRQYLKEIYREDILNLEELIGRDLKDWLR